AYWSAKANIHTRFENLPEHPEFLHYSLPGSDLSGMFIAFNGTVIKAGTNKTQERAKMFKCKKCKAMFEIAVDDALKDPEYACVGTQFEMITDPNYQEIRVQEQVGRLEIGTMPKAITVILKNDLVNKVKVGDNVSAIGTLIRKWKVTKPNEPCVLDLVFVGNNIIQTNEKTSILSISDNIKKEFKLFWESRRENELLGRNFIVQQFCPNIFGRFQVKLAVLLLLLGGNSKNGTNGTKTRGEPHVLLLGDPSTAKSQFLKAAALLSPRSILTTGTGTSTAGLTVSAVRESGSWSLEAGALVLADRGICCIDEFGCVSTSDRMAIHEAMEQQTLSIAKAGIVCKLNTRCSILAATNPKGNFDTKESLASNSSLSSPLLSRFDLILLLIDRKDKDLDSCIADCILRDEKSETENEWSLEKLKMFINFAKNEFAPELTENASNIITAYYQLQRSQEDAASGRTTMRLLESMIRLTQAHAKLLFHEKAEIFDAVSVVLLFESAMHNGMIFGNTSFLIDSLFQENPNDEYQAMGTSPFLCLLRIHSIGITQSRLFILSISNYLINPSLLASLPEQ
ncbi:MCM-domain-containing protein, partial [Rozella allomycis CSF55]